MNHTFPNSRDTVARSGIFHAPGAELFYEEKGSGVPLLFIHAGIADSRMWENEFQLLSSRFRAVRFDLPGFGGSDFTGGSVSYSALLAGLMEHLHIERAHILAASFGGKIALDFALAYPEKCLGLALESPALSGWEDSSVLREYGAEEARLMEQGRPEEVAKLNLATWILRGRAPDAVGVSVCRLVMDMQMKAYEKPEPACPYEETETEDILPLLGTIQPPLLLLVGSLDLPDFQEIVELICEKAPSARKVALPGAAHLANLEAPSLFGQTVLDFLQNAGKTSENEI